MKKQTGLLPYSKIRGFQIDDCLFQGGLNFVNLNCQLLETCNSMRPILLISTSWHIKFTKIDATLWKAGGPVSSIWHPITKRCCAWPKKIYTVLQHNHAEHRVVRTQLTDICTRSSSSPGSSDRPRFMKLSSPPSKLNIKRPEAAPFKVTLLYKPV